MPLPLCSTFSQIYDHHRCTRNSSRYLHDRPHSVILHCLERKSKSAKYAVHSVHDVDPDLGIFEIATQPIAKFGTSDDMPSCIVQRLVFVPTIPCKHFFAIFTHRPNWSWDQLPSTYQNSAYVKWTRLPWTHSPRSHHHIHQLLGQVRNAAMVSLLGKTVMITSNRNAVMISLRISVNSLLAVNCQQSKIYSQVVSLFTKILTGTRTIQQFHKCIRYIFHTFPFSNLLKDREISLLVTDLHVT